MPNIVAAALCRCPGHFRWAAVVAVHLLDDITHKGHSEEDGHDDDDDEQALAGRRQAVERVLSLQRWVFLFLIPIWTDNDGCRNN